MAKRRTRAEPASAAKAASQSSKWRGISGKIAPFALVTATTNFLWGFLGPRQSDFLLVAVMFFALDRGVRLLIAKRSNIGFVHIVVLRMMIFPVALIAVLAVFVSALSYFIKADLAKPQMDYRASYMLESRHALYAGADVLPRIVSFVNHLRFRPYYPELLDRSNRYESIAATYYQLERLGIVEYEVRGSCWPQNRDSTVAHFVFQAEHPIEFDAGLVQVCDCSGRDLPASLQPLAHGKEPYSVYGKVRLPKNFCFRRSFCAPKSMRQQQEGFFLVLEDLRNPPATVGVTLVTDRDISDPLLMEVERRRFTISDWLFANPTYRTVATLGSLTKVADADTLVRYQEVLARGKHSYSSARPLKVYRTRVAPSRGVLLVRYLVAK